MSPLRVKVVTAPAAGTRVTTVRERSPAGSSTRPVTTIGRAALLRDLEAQVVEPRAPAAAEQRAEDETRAARGRRCAPVAPPPRWCPHGSAALLAKATRGIGAQPHPAQRRLLGPDPARSPSPCRAAGRRASSRRAELSALADGGDEQERAPPWARWVRSRSGTHCAAAPAARQLAGELSNPSSARERFGGAAPGARDRRVKRWAARVDSPRRSPRPRPAPPHIAHPVSYPIPRHPTADRHERSRKECCSDHRLRVGGCFLCTGRCSAAGAVEILSPASPGAVVT